MLATTDTMILTRMAVIGRRTNSALMAGAKAMMASTPAAYGVESPTLVWRALKG